MIIDTHCHLYEPVFANMQETLQTALAHDVWGVVGVGCDVDTNERTLALATANSKMVWACLGFHPDRVHLSDDDLDRVEQQVIEHHARIIGLGEVGLPWYCLQSSADPERTMERGRVRLNRLLALAGRYDLAVALHAPHGAAAGALKALKHHGIERAVFHWHKAPPDVTRDIVEAGYFVSVGPEVVYRERDRELASSVPLDSLLVESDAPWKYSGEFEGLDSGPWFAARVAEELAKIKQLPVADVMFRLSTNACRLFDLVWA